VTGRRSPTTTLHSKPNLRPKPTPPKPYQILLWITRSRPLPRSKKFSCFTRPMSSTLPSEPLDQAKMPEVPAQARTTEVFCTSHLRGCRHYHKSSKTTRVLTNTKSKNGRRKSQTMKPEKRRSSPEFSKRLTCFVRSKRPYPEGRQRLNGPKRGNNTLIEKEQN
jgi:hypothetical protein